MKPVWTSWTRSAKLVVSEERDCGNTCAIDIAGEVDGSVGDIYEIIEGRQAGRQAAPYEGERREHLPDKESWEKWQKHKI